MTVRAQARARQEAEIEASAERALATRERERSRPMTAMESMSLRLGVSENELIDALTATVFAGCRSKAEFLALVVVANEYRLNPLTKEIYAFPAKGGGVVPMISVDGWITLMNSHPQFDGIEFENFEDDKGSTFAIEAVIYRKDRSKPIKVTEYMDECKRNTDPWKTSPRRMLRHRALIQCARVAFGFSGVYAQGDDVNGVIDADWSVVPSEPTVLPASKPAKKAETAKPEPSDQFAGRNPQTGMTEVDEETARALDAGDQSVNDLDGPLDPEEPADEQPAWATPVFLVRQLIQKATNSSTWNKADTEFQKIAAGLPDEVAEELNNELAAKRRELQEGK